MTINIDCPRCQMHLQISARQKGSYVNCPHCKGRLWVDKDVPASVPQTAAVETSTGGNGSARGTSVGPCLPVSPTKISAPARPLPVPLARKRPARFIAADAAQSTLRLAADGKLPKLQMEESLVKDKSETGTRTLNPLVILGGLGMSVVLSAVLVLTGMDSSGDSGLAQKTQMRQLIEEQYFGPGDADGRGLEPYQFLLREAQRAYARGDHKAEREQYRKVLDLLRAERDIQEKGLAGSRSRDKALEEAIAVLLGGTS